MYRAVVSLSIVSALLLVIEPSCAAAQQKLALLIGCTVYPHAKEECSELYGARNDIPNFADLLTKKFGFQDRDIVRLVGWAEKKSQQPTYKNIMKRMSQLVKQTRKDDQVVIYFSGHGSQAPMKIGANQLDPNNLEEDGLDEIFLAADFRVDKSGQLHNFVRDDEIREFLGKLKNRGASVWVIFDCCHSGTMIRSGDVERSRSVPLAKFNIPAEVIQKSIRLAKKQAKANTGALELGNNKGKGSVVALYAAQPFETTPELPRPWDAEEKPQNYYGLLSYTLLAVLKNAEQPLTYRELTQQLVNHYRGERGSRGPTPFSEGDLDNEVLGQKQWPERSKMIIQRKSGNLIVNAGELMGLSTDAVLSVHPPAGNKQSEKETIGYVKVKTLTPVTATVEPCPDPANSSTTVKEVDIPNLAQCKMVSKHFGDMRLNLALSEQLCADQIKIIKSALNSLSERTGAMVHVTDNPARAQWVIQVEDNSVYLVPGLERNSANDSKQKLTFRLGGYPLDRKTFVGYFNRDLPRIFKVENLWRIAGRMESGDTTLSLEVTKVGNGIDSPIRNGDRVRPGQKVRINIANNSFKTQWVTLLLIDGHYGIKTFQFAVRANRTFQSPPFKLKNDTHGLTGAIAFSTPLAVNQPKPNLDFLAQERLKVVAIDRGTAKMAPKDPFGQLLSMAAFHSGTRSLLLGHSSTPQVSSRCFFLLPELE